MNETELARRIVARLNEHLDRLPAPILQKLREARETALARRDGAKPARVRPHGGGFLGMGPRLAVPAALVIAVLGGLIYWQISVHNEDDPDAEMLAGELPIHAIIDPGFESWLQNASHSPRQSSR